MASVDSLLDTILQSVDGTTASIDSLIAGLDDKEVPELISELRKETEDNSEGISLLTLKNLSLLGYLDTLAVIIGSKLESLTQDDDSKLKDQSVTNSVVHRVTLDKGVKPLERKLNYQLDKLMDAYRRRKHEQEDLEKKKGQEGDVDEEDEEFSEEEGLNFRPDASALRKSVTSSGNDKYRPPKISAALPPTATQGKDKRRRNLQSMDEYLESLADAPTVEGSIGATISNKGKEVKSKRQLEKEAQLTRYEEENFIRLPKTKTQTSQDEQKRRRNEFMGEDWSMFENSRDISSSLKRHKKQNAWRNAKRKQTE